jgi:hypothetical protein
MSNIFVFVEADAEGGNNLNGIFAAFIDWNCNCETTSGFCVFV